MKKLLFTLFLGITGAILYAQSAQFGWMNGSSSPYQYGVYGTKGVSSATNSPGYRSDHVSWTNNIGNLWMFGGTGYAVSGASGQLNDLWKYNVATNEWTWMSGSNLVNQLGSYGTKGISSPTNAPGSRYSSATWIDNSGNLWLFGGNGKATTATNGYLNDLWKYDVTTNEWVWISGSNAINQVGTYGTKGVPTASTVPGGRYDAITWVDNSGNLWLHGGNGLATTASGGLLNDLWKFDVLTNQWTWISGSNTINQTCTYGIKGTSGPSNVPGGRSGSSSFKDSNGDFWLWGGNGIPGTVTVGMLCDLWRYSFSNNQWTWMSGTSSAGSTGVYGSKGFPALANYPGGRMDLVTWVDSQDNFWLYGGTGAGSVAGNGSLNDLWQFNKTTNMWVWVSGSNTINQAAVYGTLGVTSLTNTPGGRYKACSWTDNLGAFWLYGGSVVGGEKSDLWKIEICNAPASPSATSQTICVGSTATLTASGTANLSWYSGATSGTYLGNGNLYVSPTLTANTTYYVQDSTCAQSLRTPVVVTVTQPTINVAGSNTVCLNSSAILTASGALTYTWSTSQNTNTVLVVPTATTIYTVTGSDAFGCMSSKTKTLTTVAIPSVSIAGSGSVCAGSGIILTASGANSYTWSTGSTAANILVAPSSTFVYTVTGKTTSTGCVNTQTALVTVQSPSVTIAGNFALCQSSSSTYTASGANTYSWTSSGISPVYTNTAVLYPNGTVYTLIGKDLQGCTKTQTFVITALTNPSVNISLPSQGCPGQTVTMNASGASTYTWMPGNIVGSSAAVSPSVNTTYTLYGTAANTCTNANTAILTVKTAPTINISGGNSAICSGSSVSISASGASTYTWSTLQTTGSITVTPTATSSYTVIGTAANACTNTAVKTITVNALPTLTVTGNNVLCAGNSTTLTASGANTYTWSSGFLVPAIGVTPLTSTNYSVIGKDANNCTNMTTYFVTVNNLPTVTANATSTSVCNGLSTTLTGGGATTYTWSNSVSDGVSFAPSSSNTYTVNGTDVNGCQNMAMVTVNVNNLPTVTANSTASAVCAGSNVTLTGGGATTYTWSGTVINGTAFSPSASDNYTVTGTDANGCVNSSSVSVAVNNTPTVTANSTSTLACVGDNIVLTGGGASTYTWTGGVTDGVGFPASTSDTYTVTGYDVNGCSNTAIVSVSVNVCTGLKSIATSNIISVFPNPNNGEFTIQSQKADIVNIMNDLGQVLEVIVLNDDNNNSYKVNNLPNGIYFLVGKTIKQKIIVTQ